jgi:hypothetical protein
MEHTPKAPHLSATCTVCGTTGYEANRPCPLHAAAAKLLAALVKLVAIAGCSHFPGQTPKCDYCKARAAIEEAKK